MTLGRELTEASLERELKKLLAGALWGTFDEDSEFLSHKVSEVAAVAPIFARMYCQGFPGYRVENEYDREGKVGKHKNSNYDESGHESGWKRPDVIVHQRGHDRGNLLVVEFKLTADDSADQEKIRRMMGESRNYRFGATVVLDKKYGGPKWRWFNSRTDHPDLVQVPRPDSIE